MPDGTRGAGSIAAAINTLAFDAFAAFSGATNLVFSPIGLHVALRMLAEGAKGETLDALASALRADRESGILQPLGELGRLFAELSRGARSGRLLQRSSKLQLSIATGLWVQSGYSCQEGFVEATQSELGSAVDHADLQGQPVQAAKIINEWIEARTRGRVTRVVEPGSLDPLTRAILTNTLYFKAPWRKVFQSTSPGEFHRFDGTVVTTDLMNGSLENLGHLRANEMNAVELPYNSPAFSMWVIWPAASGETAFAALEDSLPMHWDELCRNAERATKVWLTMPEFRVRSLLDMVDADLWPGLAPAFAPGADFSGISNEPGFRVDRIRQSAYISVDRFGTEAAAATHVSMIGALPIVLTVDRPFLFAIVHNPSRTLLFMGKVLDPTDE